MKTDCEGIKNELESSIEKFNREMNERWLKTLDFYEKKDDAGILLRVTEFGVRSGFSDGSYLDFCRHPLYHKELFSPTDGTLLIEFLRKMFDKNWVEQTIYDLSELDDKYDTLRYSNADKETETLANEMEYRLHYMQDYKHVFYSHDEDL